jgi:thiol:disulfide interchange protein DsbD
MAGTCGLLLTLGIGCWLLGILRNRIIGLLLAGLLTLGGWHFLVRHPLSSPAVSALKETQTDGWEPFSPKHLETERAAGRAVFVDFTASWCLNCKVNERVALSQKDVVDAFNRIGVVRMKADWTSNDPVITEELKKFGRVSVPFYLLYAPNASEPQILPTVLTPGIMLEALNALPAASKPTGTPK